MKTNAGEIQARENGIGLGEEKGEFASLFPWVVLIF